MDANKDDCGHYYKKTVNVTLADGSVKTHVYLRAVTDHHQRANTKLTPDQIASARVDRCNGASVKALGEKYGVSTYMMKKMLKVDR